MENKVNHHGKERERLLTQNSEIKVKQKNSKTKSDQQIEFLTKRNEKLQTEITALTEKEAPVDQTVIIQDLQDRLGFSVSVNLIL